jgi:hypothetical protein
MLGAMNLTFGYSFISLFTYFVIFYLFSTSVISRHFSTPDDAETHSRKIGDNKNNKDNDNSRCPLRER